MRRGEVVVGVGAEWESAPDRRAPLPTLLRRWNRLSRLQKTLVYGVVVVGALASLHFYLDRDPPPPPPPAHPEHAPADPAAAAAAAAAAAVSAQPLRGNEEKIPPAQGSVAGAADDGGKPGDNGEVPNKEKMVFLGPTTARQAAVVAAFKHAWSGYRRHAWGHDNLRPVSGTHSDWFSLGLTIVDSMDTAYIMALADEYEEARRWVRDELAFTRDKDVNLFEVTIRVLGALLANYHLSGDAMFARRARELGARLLPAFAAPARVPYSDVNLGARTAHAPAWAPYSSTAEVATLQLEFRELARVTGEARFERAAAAVSEHLHALPKRAGLVPMFLSPATGRFLPHAALTLGARADSYYEYLLKQWLQTGKTIHYFVEDYLAAVEGMEQLLMRRSSPSNLLFVGELAAGSEAFVPKMDHLACFLPGTLALGAAHGLPARHLTLAAELLRTCYETYARHPTFLAPEITHFNTDNDGGGGDDMYVKSADAHSLLRPEFVESLYVMYQLTGNATYQEWGWRVFGALERHARAPHGYSSLADVRALPPPPRDMMETFFLAETLKYLYLLFSDDRRLLDLDKFVLNSEAHLLPIHDH